MKKSDYHEKMDKIIRLPQFEKYEKPRKNAIHPVLKEEERVKGILKTLLEEGKIDEALYEQIRPRGSQPARLYGLAKVHKNNIPVRPVLSMPSSAYHGVAEFVAKCLSIVPECKINASTKLICDDLRPVILKEDEEIISFDVVSLYTNVPVMEAIEVCTDLLFALPPDQRPSIEKDTFITLAKIASCDVLMSTHDGYYRQIDGLAMGSPPAPHLANGWLSRYDPVIKGESRLYYRYMDDILKEEKRDNVDRKLHEINSLHANLKFTVEREQNHQLPVLDMKICHDPVSGRLVSTWYNKPTDTGLIMNFHALAPKRYKRSVVSGFIYRIHRACSTWELFHESLEKAKRILERNQYPPAFYEPIIKQALEAIIGAPPSLTPDSQPPTNPKSERIPIMVQYRGKCTESFARALHKVNAPCVVVMTLRKLKTVLPSLKPAVEKMIRSGVVYELCCSRCTACYVGQTCRHMQSRFKEHLSRAGPVRSHLAQCNTTITDKDVDILQQTSRGESFLLTLEALYIRERRPSINTKDEYRSRELTIKL